MSDDKAGLDAAVDQQYKLVHGQALEAWAKGDDPKNPPPEREMKLRAFWANFVANDASYDLVVREIRSGAFEPLYAAATTMPEIGDILWSARAYVYDEVYGGVDPDNIPQCSPPAVAGVLVYTAAMGLWYEHAERVLGHPPYAFDQQDIDGGFLDPDGDGMMARGLDRGRRYLRQVELSRLSPVARVFSPDERPRGNWWRRYAGWINLTEMLGGTNWHGPKICMPQFVIWDSRRDRPMHPHASVMHGELRQHEDGSISWDQQTTLHFLTDAPLNLEHWKDLHGCSASRVQRWRPRYRGGSGRLSGPDYALISGFHDACGDR